MTLLRCATHVVANLAATAERYRQWLDYSVIEEGRVTEALASSWDAPATYGRGQIVLQPASGARVFLRFIEGDPVPSYRPIRTTGWAAIEICIQDVAAIHERMLRSPFEVIGPPRPIPGFPTIHPMQVRGGDHETVYLTEITVDGPKFGLPVPAAPVDRPFILVLACADLKRSAAWCRDVLGLDVSEPAAIPYSMIAQAFDLPASDLHEIVTAKWNGEVFLELDQYPAAVVEREAHPGALPPGVAIMSMVHPRFDRLDGHWVSAPQTHPGAIYEGRRVGVLRTPEGALLEVIDGAEAN